MTYIAKQSVGTAKAGEVVEGLTEARAKFLLERGVIVESDKAEVSVDADADADADDESELESMTNTQLKDLIKAGGGEAPAGANKAELIAIAESL